MISAPTFLKLLKDQIIVQLFGFLYPDSNQTMEYYAFIVKMIKCVHQGLTFLEDVFNHISPDGMVIVLQISSSEDALYIIRSRIFEVLNLITYQNSSQQ